ncbi:hypothetical protein SM12VA4_18880 [Serratia marcescens]|nr:hypothetical protein SM12VA4_18880 [Serratia marcescens]
MQTALCDVSRNCGDAFFAPYTGTRRLISTT